MENRFLTAGNLIEDLQKCDPNAEVACMMAGCEVSIPIGQMSKVTASGKPYVLMMVSPQSIQYAMAAMEELKNAAAAPKEGDLVN